MSSEALIESLRAQHKSLEAKLDNENHRPSPDADILHDIKREKLKIKDRLAELEAQTG